MQAMLRIEPREICFGSNLLDQGYRLHIRGILGTFSLKEAFLVNNHQDLKRRFSGRAAFCGNQPYY